MNKCSECQRLREETSSLYSGYILRRDALAMTPKRDKAYDSLRRQLEKTQGQLSEARRREEEHRDEFHSGHGSPDEEFAVPERLAQLRESLSLGDESGVQRVIFELGPTHSGMRTVPDEVVEGLLTILRSPEMYTSSLSGHVLNYFEFEAGNLTKRQKQLCQAFLNAHGNSFSDVFSRQVVAELREGSWLL